MAVATSNDLELHPTCPASNKPIVFSGDERFGNSLRPPLSWLGVSVTLTVGFRPQLHAVATIVAAIRLKAFMSNTPDSVYVLSWILAVDVTLTP